MPTPEIALFMYKATTKKHSPRAVTALLCSMALLLFACGSQISIYEWQQIAVQNTDRQTGNDLEGDARTPLSNYAISVTFSAQPVADLSNNIAFVRDAGFQSNDRIRSIEIRSNTRFLENLSADSLLNAYFVAQPIGSDEVFTLEEFRQVFGTLGPQIDEGFRLLPVDGLAPFTPTHQFSILINLSRGALLGAQTERVTFE